MKWDVSIKTNGEQPYSTVDDLTEYEREIIPYAYCLPRYAKMDGNYLNAPDSISPQYGYISTYLSDATMMFETSPSISVKFDRMKTSNGILLAFNKLSGDYASDLSISWYKDDELVKTNYFNPDSTEYFCESKVPLFNRIEITFLKTSKPNRYLWISLIKNQKLTDAGGLKIIYEDIALRAKEDATASTNDKDSYVDLTNLKKVVDFPDYAYCLPRYAKMDGNYSNVINIGDTGYVSNSISNQNGVFDVPPTLTFSFTQTYSSVGITLRFNDHSEDYCKKINIKWYFNNNLLSEQTYYPDGYDYFCYNIVDYYNKVVITFLETDKPYRKVFLTSITWGLNRILRDDEIEEISCILESNPISEEISVNTMEYTFKNKTEYEFEFQKRQKQTLLFDEAIIGIFYLKDGVQMEAKRYSVQTEDAVGILENNQFDGGIYTNKLVKELLNEIMKDEDIEYFIDESYSTKTVSGYIPICSKRAALQQLAFAIGATVSTAYDRQLYVSPQQTEVTDEFVDKDIYMGVSVEHSDIVSGIRLYSHSYTKSEESDELYKDILTGTIKIELSDPHHSYTITNGTIVSYDVNYVYINGTGKEVILTGKKYNHNTTVMLKENVKITKNKNIAEVKEATLVTASNAQDVLERVYAYYQNNEYVKFKSVINEQLLGNVATVQTGFRGTMQGTIQQLDFNFSRKKVIAEVTIK